MGRASKHSMNCVMTPNGILHRSQRVAEHYERRRAGDLLPATHGISRLEGFNGPKPSPFKVCQWIEGEIPERGVGYAELGMCGAPTAPGSSYCAAHQARCTNHPPSKVQLRPTNVPGFSGPIAPFSMRRIAK